MPDDALVGGNRACLDNLREIEQYEVGQMLDDPGLETIAFDGPGQGEMWAAMKLIPIFTRR